MTPKQRWLILGSVLLATLAAGYMIDDEALPDSAKPQKSATSAPRPQAERRTSVNDTTDATPLAPLNFPDPASSATLKDDKAIDPFRNKSWVIALPPPPPAKPTAPPLPFQYLGKLVEDDGVRVFLNHQGKNLIVKAGDVINGIYTVQDIAGNQMTFLYHPLKEKQSLSLGTDK